MPSRIPVAGTPYGEAHPAGQQAVTSLSPKTIDNRARAAQYGIPPTVNPLNVREVERVFAQQGLTGEALGERLYQYADEQGLIHHPDWIENLTKYFTIGSAALAGGAALGAFGGGGGGGAVPGLSASTVDLSALYPGGTGAGMGAAAAAGKSLLSPSTVNLVKGIGEGFKAFGDLRSRGQDRESQEKIAREALAQREQESLRDNASREATLDPYRQQKQQARAALGLNFLRDARNPASSLKPAARYASNVSDFRPSYEADETLRGDADRLLQDVRAGHTAPTMTDPANYGDTAALDLTQPPAPPQPGLLSSPLLNLRRRTRRAPGRV